MLRMSAQVCTNEPTCTTLATPLFITCVECASYHCCISVIGSINDKAVRLPSTTKAVHKRKSNYH